MPALNRVPGAKELYFQKISPSYHLSHFPSYSRGILYHFFKIYFQIIIKIIVFIFSTVVCCGENSKSFSVFTKVTGYGFEDEEVTDLETYCDKCKLYQRYTYTDTWLT